MNANSEKPMDGFPDITNCRGCWFEEGTTNTTPAFYWPQIKPTWLCQTCIDKYKQNKQRGLYDAIKIPEVY